MLVLVIGTSGQLAIELHRARHSERLQLVPPEKVDITDTRALLELLERTRPQLVINASAYTAVDRAESEAERAFAVNEAGPRELARWCRAQQAPLLHVSTDYVFDGESQAPYRESDPVRPLGVYGASKLAGEQAIAAELPEHVILRTSWVFSAHGNNFVKTMLRLAREREELRVVADQAGRPTGAASLAAALLALAERHALNEALSFGTYHFAGAGQTTWHGFAQAIVDAQAPFTGRNPKVVAITTSEYPTPARRPANSVLDTSLFERTFGLEPGPWTSDLAEVARELLDARP